MELGAQDRELFDQLKGSIVAICLRKKQFIHKLLIQGILNVVADEKTVYVVSLNEVVSIGGSGSGGSEVSEKAGDKAQTNLDVDSGQAQSNTKQRQTNNVGKKKQKKSSVEVEEAVERQRQNLNEFIELQMRRHNVKRKSQEPQDEITTPKVSKKTEQTTKKNDVKMDQPAKTSTPSNTRGLTKLKSVSTPQKEAQVPGVSQSITGSSGTPRHDMNTPESPPLGSNTSGGPYPATSQSCPRSFPAASRTIQASVTPQKNQTASETPQKNQAARPALKGKKGPSSAFKAPKGKNMTPVTASGLLTVLRNFGPKISTNQRGRPANIGGKAASSHLTSLQQQLPTSMAPQHQQPIKIKRNDNLRKLMVNTGDKIHNKKESSKSGNNALPPGRPAISQQNMGQQPDVSQRVTSQTEKERNQSGLHPAAQTHLKPSSAMEATRPVFPSPNEPGPSLEPPRPRIAATADDVPTTGYGVTPESQDYSDLETEIPEMDDVKTAGDQDQKDDRNIPGVVKVQSQGYAGSQVAAQNLAVSSASQIRQIARSNPSVDVPFQAYGGQQVETSGWASSHGAGQVPRNMDGPSQLHARPQITEPSLLGSLLERANIIPSSSASDVNVTLRTFAIPQVSASQSNNQVANVIPSNSSRNVNVPPRSIAVPQVTNNESNIQGAPSYVGPQIQAPNRQDFDPFDPVSLIHDLKDFFEQEREAALANAMPTAATKPASARPTGEYADLSVMAEVQNQLTKSAGNIAQLPPTSASFPNSSQSSSTCNAVTIAPIKTEDEETQSSKEELPRMLRECRENSPEVKDHPDRNQGPSISDRTAETSVEPRSTTPVVPNNQKEVTKREIVEAPPTKVVIVIDDEHENQNEAAPSTSNDKIKDEDESIATSASGEVGSSKRLLECPSCPMKYSTEDALGKHYDRVHVQPNRLKKGLEQSKQARRTPEIGQSEDSVALLDGKAFSCSFCEQKFVTISSLQTHMNARHNRNCPICNSAYTTANKLKVHMEVLHSGVPVFFCPRCSRCFLTHKSMKQHERSCVVKTMLPCTMCANSYRTAGALNNHVHKVHGSTLQSLETDFGCIQCNVKFTTKQAYDSHNKQFHAI